MSALDGGTYFYHVDGHSLGDSDQLLPLPLFKGMKITIHGHEDTFEVVDWNYHYGQGDEKPGLRILLKPTGKPGKTGVFPFRV